MNLDIIIGARPNFVKAFPLISNINKYKKIRFRLIHTGQHYDRLMADVFFKEFKFYKNITYLNVKNNDSNQFISDVIKKYKKIIQNSKPDLTILFGDVNSTLAVAIACNKSVIPIAHIEAGLRSYDKLMPEEHNRVITDHLSDLLFVTTLNAKKNLIKENISKDKIFFVGNIMIETLIRFKNKLNKRKKTNKKYIVLTIHRPENTKNLKKIKEYFNILEYSLDKNTIVYFPVHHSVKSKINLLNYSKIKFIKPMSYLNFISLLKYSNGVVTDSGGITEEATYMNIPCISLRNNTERPETITHGTNHLISNDLNKFSKLLKKMDKGVWKINKSIKNWDDKVSKRILDIIYNSFNAKKN